MSGRLTKQVLLNAPFKTCLSHWCERGISLGYRFLGAFYICILRKCMYLGCTTIVYWDVQGHIRYYGIVGYERKG